MEIIEEGSTQLMIDTNSLSIEGLASISNSSILTLQLTNLWKYWWKKNPLFLRNTFHVYLDIILTKKF